MAGVSSLDAIVRLDGVISTQWPHRFACAQRRSCTFAASLAREWLGEHRSCCTSSPGSPRGPMVACLRRQPNSAASDVFSLGLVVYYLLTGGAHALGAPAERTMHLYTLDAGMPGATALAASLARLEGAARELVAAMLHPDPARRPTAERLLAHPLLQDEAVRELREELEDKEELVGHLVLSENNKMTEIDRLKARIAELER